MSVERKLNEWKRQLLDLSKRNRLLHFRETRRLTLRVAQPSTDAVFHRLVGREKSFTVTGLAQAELFEFGEADESAQPYAIRERRVSEHEILFDGTPERISTALYTLRSKSKSELEERGVGVLFMAMGFLTWFESEQSDFAIKSPLLLVPVVLERESASDPYTIVPSDDDIAVNPTLAKVLEDDFNIALPELRQDADSIEGYLETVRKLVARHARWTLEDDCYLSVFSFLKLSMYKDLEAGQATAEAHPVIAGLAGKMQLLTSAFDPAAEIPEEELDDKVRAEDCLQVLDADSSQQVAIELAKAGASFVLQGPPGTGKSQTIANIIAELLGRGRTVLFVSEKSAALQVVHRRLREAGLDEFCLSLHSFKANKRDVAVEIARVYQKGPQRRSPEEFSYQQLQRRRDELNSYVRDMHTRRMPLGLSPYQLHGRLMRLADVPDVPFSIPGATKMSPDEFELVEDSLSKLAGNAHTLRRLPSLSWVGCRRDGSSFEARRQTGEEVSRIREAIGDLLEAATRLASELRVEPPASFQAAIWSSDVGRSLAASPEIVPSWLTEGIAENALQLMAERRAQLEAERAEVTEIERHFDLALLDLDLLGLEERLERAGSKAIKILDAEFRSDMRSLKGLANNGKRPPFKEAVRIVALGQSVKRRRDWLAGNERQAQELLGSFNRGHETDWAGLQSSIEWAIQFRGAFGGSAPLELVAEYESIAGRREVIDGLAKQTASLVSQAQRLLAALLSDFEELPEPWPKPLRGLEEWALTNIERALDGMLDDIDGMQAWTRLKEAVDECEKAGCIDAPWRVLEVDLAEDLFVPAGRKRFLMLWLDEISSQAPILGKFDASRHSRVIDEYRRLDREQLDAARRQLSYATSMRRPAPSAAAVNVASSQPSRLMKEAKKKRRILPLRKLFAAIPDLLLAVKPCLMMSPLSVSYFLELGALSFDAVVFDEASQVKPEDAVGAIMRGKQVIVVGDSKQLPPTSFFDVAVGSDEWDEDIDESDEGAFESILDLCDTLQPHLRSKMLRWHYRSRHEGLIAFSNRFLYDGQLITFPAAEFDGAGTGVKLHYVSDGVYDGGKSGTKTNRREVEEVVNLVAEHAAKRPDATLGVVAFSEAQMTAIDQAVWRYRAEHPEHESFFTGGGHEPFFVKNLENVQGDERDVILFSIGYGPDPQGRIRMNFGPLNKQGGERRLNVAVTRARSNVVVVASIRAGNIDLSRTDKEGPRLLKAYLDYAERGEAALEDFCEVDPDAEYGSEFEEDVGTVIESMGYKVHRQVGCSGYRIDLGIVHPEYPGSYALGIECDGASYHSAATARERDRLREEVLRRLGWKLYRIWSTDWFRSRDVQMGRLETAIREAVEAGRPCAVTETRQEHEPSEVERETMVPLEADVIVLPTEVEYAGIVDYSPACIRHHRTDLFNSLREVREAVVQVVQEEGPVHEDLVFRYVANCWGFERTGSRIREMAELGARSAVSSGAVIRRGDFYWPAGMETPPVRRNTHGYPARGIREIALEELAEAVALVLNEQLALRRDDLILCTARALGFERTGKDVRAALDTAVDRAVKAERIQVESDGTCLREPGGAA